MIKRLHFSNAETSSHPFPEEPKEHKSNYHAQKGETLSYIPPNSKKGKFMVNIVEEDVKYQEEYWKNALIRYIIGDTSYMKLMKLYAG